MLSRGVETAFGRALLAPLRDDAGGVRLMREGDRKHLLGRGHFKVQRQIDLGHQAVDVAVGDVATVLAQMRGDPVRASFGGHDRCSHRVGMVAAARVPDGRDMVDIDAETEPVGHAAARLPGLTAGIAASSGGSESAS